MGGRPCTLAITASHDARNLGDSLGDGGVGSLLVLASGNMTLLWVDYDVLCFLVYLVRDTTDVRALAIMMIELSCISLIIYDVASSSSFRSVDSRPSIDIRPRWLSLVICMRWSTLLLRAPMSCISCSTWVLWHRT